MWTGYTSVGLGTATTDWVKVKGNGASANNPGVAGAGGLVRDETGNWKGGFYCNLGIASNSAAELWAIIPWLKVETSLAEERCR